MMENNLRIFDRDETAMNIFKFHFKIIKLFIFKKFELAKGWMERLVRDRRLSLYVRTIESEENSFITWAPGGLYHKTVFELFNLSFFPQIYNI